MNNHIAISEHCIDRYLERIAPSAVRRSPDARRLARLELALSLSDPPLCDLATAEGHRLLGVRNPAGYAYMIKLSAAGDVAETCGPRWFWHEARRHWRALGYACSKGNPQTRAAARLRRRARREAEQQAGKSATETREGGDAGEE